MMIITYILPPSLDDKLMSARDFQALNFNKIIFEFYLTFTRKCFRKKIYIL